MDTSGEVGGLFGFQVYAHQDVGTSDQGGPVYSIENPCPDQRCIICHDIIAEESKG